jgi:hypothetical protein
MKQKCERKERFALPSLPLDTQEIQKTKSGFFFLWESLVALMAENLLKLSSSRRPSNVLIFPSSSFCQTVRFFVASDPRVSLDVLLQTNFRDGYRLEQGIVGQFSDQQHDWRLDY